MKFDGNKIKTDMKDYLESRVAMYNNITYIENDPVSIPHLFSSEENIAISGFLTAIISWGQRPQIIKSAKNLMALMDNNPHEFILHSGKKELSRFKYFYYRTFNGVDCLFFIECLKDLYKSGNSLRQLFEGQYSEFHNMKAAISGFREQFFLKDFYPVHSTPKI